MGRAPVGSAPRVRLPSLDRIGVEAVAAQQRDVSAEQEELLKRLDKLEVYAEQVGRQTELVEKLSDYVTSLKAEVDALYGIRIAAMVFAAGFVVCICAFATFALLREPRWVLHNHTHAVAALIVTTVGASVALIALVLKGAFRSIGDRNESELLPENLKTLVETVKTLADAAGIKH